MTAPAPDMQPLNIFAVYVESHRATMAAAVCRAGIPLPATAGVGTPALQGHLHV